MTDTTKKTLLQSAGTVGGLTLMSRVAGLGRDVLLAAVLGTGAWADVFVVALRLPNMFRRLVAEGAFASAFVPVFARAQSPGQARDFAENCLSAGLIFLLVVTTVAEIFMPFLVFVLAGGFGSEKLEMAVPMAQITFPYLLSMFLVALYGGMAGTRGRFWAEAAGPIILNICLVGALCVVGFLQQQKYVPLLAWGVFLAGVLQAVLLMRVCARLGLSLRVRRPRLTPQMKKFLTVFCPACLAGLMPQLTILVSTRIASAQEGAVSVLFYAERLYQLPLGVVGVALGTVLLPRLSKSLAQEDFCKAQKIQNRALEYGLLLTVPAAVGLVVLSQVVVETVFGYGAFDAARITAYTCAAFALGLPGFVLVRLLSVSFFARQNSKIPLGAAGLGAFINIVLAFMLFGPLGVVGLALATALGGWVQALGLLFWAIQKNFWRGDARLLHVSLRVLLASAVMGGFLFFIQPATVPESFAGRVGILVGLVIGGVAVYACGLGRVIWRTVQEFKQK